MFFGFGARDNDFCSSVVFLGFFYGIFFILSCVISNKAPIRLTVARSIETLQIMSFKSSNGFRKQKVFTGKSATDLGKWFQNHHKTPKEPHKHQQVLEYSNSCHVHHTPTLDITNRHNTKNRPFINGHSRESDVFFKSGAEEIIKFNI